MIPHKHKVFRALRGNALRQLRILLRIKARAKAPVLAQPLEQAIERHAGICRLLFKLIPEIEGQGLSGASVCEVGPGDCLATAALMAGLGASHITLVEFQPPALSRRQIEVLTGVRQQGLPLDLTILQGGGAPKLDESRITYHQKLMEDFDAPPAHQLLFSNHVLEHVEDIEGFFRSCAQVLKPGGKMVHVVDLGGHGEFEDPMPPLDFHLYDDWLYKMMYPEGHRATRRFVGDYVQAASAAGFTAITTGAERSLDLAEVERIKPQLRPRARERSNEELAIIEFALTAIKA